jgi:hypothetical protein
MKFLGWIFFAVGVGLILYGLNIETIAVSRGGIDALSNARIPLEKLLFAVLGGLLLTAGCVLAGTSAVVAAVAQLSQRSNAQADQRIVQKPTDGVGS